MSWEKLFMLHATLTCCQRIRITIRVLVLKELTIVRSPGRDIELFSLHFFISLPQVSKLLPQIESCYHKLAKSFPQVRKSFPQVRKSFPQDRKSLSQLSKSFPQVSKLLPQVRKVVPTS